MAGRSAQGGRPGSLVEARELVALVASLSEAGDALTPEAVSAQLGVTRERAEHLIALVLSAAGADGSRLPLVEEDGGVTLAFSRGVRGRALRLTRGETMAVTAALERLGVPADDPLRARLEASTATEDVSEELVARLLGSAEAASADVMGPCADALARRQDLAFVYRKPDESAGSARLVSPLRLHLEDGTWYLDAYDLERAGERTFRLDRMSEVEVRPRRRESAEKDGVVGAEPKNRPVRLVRLTFRDPRYLELLPWHDLRPVGDDAQADAQTFETPDYGGDWLARMVAACGGTCTTDDPDLAARVQTLVRSLIC